MLHKGLEILQWNEVLNKFCRKITNSTFITFLPSENSKKFLWHYFNSAKKMQIILNSCGHFGFESPWSRWPNPASWICQPLSLFRLPPAPKLRKFERTIAAYLHLCQLVCTFHPNLFTATLKTVQFSLILT